MNSATPIEPGYAVGNDTMGLCRVLRQVAALKDEREPLSARTTALEWRVLKMALTAYTGRIMYLRGLVAGTVRLDLDGKEAGEVTARDAKYAAAKLAEILASREAPRGEAPRAQ